MRVKVPPHLKELWVRKEAHAHAKQAVLLDQGGSEKGDKLAMTRFLALFILMSAFAVSVGLSSDHASAASVYCDQHSVGGTAYGLTYKTYIDAYGDPSCSGSRKAAYDYYAYVNQNNTNIDNDYARAWECGTLLYSYGPTYRSSFGPGAWNILWGGWGGLNSCGFQADLHVRYWATGYFDFWTYTNF